MEEIYCFGGNPLDRVSERRSDSEWVTALEFRVSRSFVQSAYDEVDWDRRRAEDLASLNRLSAREGPPT